MAKKKMSNKAGFLIGIFLFLWFGLPFISLAGAFTGFAGGIIAIIVFIIILKQIIGKLQNMNFEMTALDRAMMEEKINNYSRGNKVTIPSAFYNSHREDSSFKQPGSSNRGGDVLYYENGNPVYKKKEY